LSVQVRTRSAAGQRLPEQPGRLLVLTDLHQGGGQADMRAGR
jgi:hypothetical protein